MINKNKYFIKTIPISLNILALSAVILLLIKVFFFNNLPEAFVGAYELGLVTEGIIISIFASYIFYLIIVHKKEINERMIIYPHIVIWAEVIVNNCKSQLNAFADESGVELNFNSLSEEDVKKAFESINPQHKAPLAFSVKKQANWFEFIVYYKNRSRKYISRVMSQLIFLDANLVALINQINDSTHFDTAVMLENQHFRNQDLLPFSHNFFEYYKYCYELNDYMNKEMIYN